MTPSQHKTLHGTSTHPPSYIIGADEVGYGAWAGPLFTCAFAVPRSWIPPFGLTDSKDLEPEERAALYGGLLEAGRFSLMQVSNIDIDRIGVRAALIEAHTAAIRAALIYYPDAEVILDGNVALPDLPKVRTLPKADALVPAVSAASVVAKVNRDLAMKQHHLAFPYYGWDTNVGYRSKSHVEGLKTRGYSPLHRRSYKIKELDR